MRSVGVNTNVPTTKGLAEPNHHNRVELEEVRNGAGCNGQWLCEEDDSRINEDVNSSKHIRSVQAHDGLHRPHHQAQAPLVRWERFLPIRSLKVLLVENDDSTRHVVSALLRNCSYEVTAVANGLEAWKVLIDLNKQIDLVLTEVVMPYLSGIGLLSKIMNDVTRKNTPVIMMSSDDSMGIVFNCLSKGAVDFLVKPIRKNELKTLWQHVWRKCHSQSSGSGSESGIRDNKSAKSRTQESDDDSDNSDEDDDDDDVSIELNAKGGSDNGSGTQGSWPKRVVEVDSSQPNSHDITYYRSPVANRVDLTEDDKLEIIEMGKDLEIGVPKILSCEVEDTNKKGTDNANLKKLQHDLDISMQLDSQNGTAGTEPLGSTKISNTHIEALKANHLLNNINIEHNKSIYYSNKSPALELSLKRPRDVEDADVSGQDRNVLRQSGLSAFSRYNTASNNNQTPVGNVGSCSPLDISSSEAAKPDNLQFNSNENPSQRSNGSDDMGSTTNNAFATKPDSTVVVHHNHTSTLEPLIPSTNEQVQVRHHHHHYHHHHHHVHNQKQKMVGPDKVSLKNTVSNILTASGEGNADNYGSASGSNNYKSNGENGSCWQKASSSDPVVEEGCKIESENGVAKKDDYGVVKKDNNGVTNNNKCNDGDGSGSGSGRGSSVDQQHLSQREAALVKFRQKRKERCFQKKVRYQSRKKLAEQRPRVRGQFVRHGANEVNNEDADS